MNRSLLVPFGLALALLLSAQTHQVRAEPDPPLAACSDHHWIDRGQEILLVQPAAQDRSTYGVTFALGLDVKPGDGVTLRKG